jgi:alpha(1,3/1,4) fucosyltransferase
MRLPILRIKFTDGVCGADREGILRRALERHFSIEESEDPQIVFYGEGKGLDYRRYPTAIRVYVAVENRYPDFSECDYAMTFLFLDDPRHLRLPFYVFDSDLPALLQKHEKAEATIADPRNFCAFVVSNGSRRADRRLQFFHKLNAVRPVNSGGRTLNNVGGPVADKAAFLRKHRFNLCFENHFWPGYTTEKIAHALAAGCIPIYWGNPAIAADFNPESFINVSDYGSDDAAVKHILAAADNQEIQRKYLKAPSFSGNQVNQSYDIDRLSAFFMRALQTPRQKRPLLYPKAGAFRIRRQFKVH